MQLLRRGENKPFSIHAAEITIRTNQSTSSPSAYEMSASLTDKKTYSLNMETPDRILLSIAYILHNSSSVLHLSF